MIRIEIEPVWRFKRDEHPQSIEVMIDLLNEIRVTGKITHAATRAGVSYRHAWNLIEKWSAFFEAPLVRSEEHTSELQSLRHLVCRLLLVKKSLSTDLLRLAFVIAGVAEPAPVYRRA